MRPLARLILLSVATGLLMAISFPSGPPLPRAVWGGVWPAGWICLAPLLVAAARARRGWDAAACGFVSGGIAFGIILWWIDPFLIRWARLSAPEASAVFILLVFYLALYPAIFAWCVRRWTARWGSTATLILAPAAWTALEMARGRLLTGFPWCLLGYSQHATLPAIQIADLMGVHGVSFMLACASALAASVPLRASRGAQLALAGLVIACLGYGVWRLDSLPRVEADLPVALIQANVAQEDKWEPQERDRIEAAHFEMTRRAAEGGASLIVWSESSVPISITAHPDYAGRLEALARETGADIVVGSVAYEARGKDPIPFNSAFLVRADRGIVGRYDKLHLVPFGEYVPLKRFLFFLEPLVEEASDFHPGARVTVLAGRGPVLGILICYEAIFPDLARRLVASGASLLITITNDSWYGDTAMPRQHLAQAVLRAVEERRFLLRCAGTGISAIIEPSGRVAARTELDRRTILQGKVAALEGSTLYAAAGDWFAAACVIVTALAFMLAGRTRAKSRFPGGDDVP